MRLLGYLWWLLKVPGVVARVLLDGFCGNQGDC